MGEKDYYLAFALSIGIGPKRFGVLLKAFGTARKAWFASEEEYQMLGIKNKVFEKFDHFRKAFDLQEYKKRLTTSNVSFVALCDKNYPPILKKIEDPPLVLFYKGNLDVIDWSKTIGVVGTRKITNYGREVTEKLVAELVSNGFVIVSGLALGVDTCSHATTIENEGKTLAILGSGVDLCYPRENEYLYNKIIHGFGAVISTFPMSCQPTQGTFPARNRIISGLSNGVLVTEAGVDSGALITASNAVSQGRPVFAVPGPITSRQSYGTAKLLKNGAIFIQNVDDILNYFKIKKTKPAGFVNLDLNVEEKKILELLKNESIHINELSRNSGIKIINLTTILTALELKGVVRNLGNGEFGMR